jgi:hypothetical protein
MLSVLQSTLFPASFCLPGELKARWLRKQSHGSSEHAVLPPFTLCILRCWLLNSILQKWDLQIAVAAEGATEVLATEVSFFHLAFYSSRAMST